MEAEPKMDIIKEADEKTTLKLLVLKDCKALLNALKDCKKK